MSQQSKKIAELLKLLQNTQADEIDCDAFCPKMAQLAELSEAELEKNRDHLKAYLHHLSMCPGCAEEFALVQQICADDKAT